MLAGEQACQPGGHRLVGGLQYRSGDLASQYRHLVAEQDDLDDEVGVAATGEPDQLEEATERPIQDERDMAGCSSHQPEAVKVQLTGLGWDCRHPQAPRPHDVDLRGVRPRRSVQPGRGAILTC